MIPFQFPTSCLLATLLLFVSNRHVRRDISLFVQQIAKFRNSYATIFPNYIASISTVVEHMIYILDRYNQNQNRNKSENETELELDHLQ